MRSFPLLAVAVFSGAAVTLAAAEVDFTDPRCAVGREDNIRVNALLSEETLSSSSPVTVTYQVENLSASPVALADKVITADYDAESRTITLAIGAEVPSGPSMPHMIVIPAGTKRVLTSGTFTRVVLPATRTPWTAIPRYVEIKITLLRDVSTFAPLIEQQASAPATPVALPTTLFDRWVESSDSVYLNEIPVRWTSQTRAISAESSQPGPVGSPF